MRLGRISGFEGLRLLLLGHSFSAVFRQSASWLLSNSVAIPRSDAILFKRLTPGKWGLWHRMGRSTPTFFRLASILMDPHVSARRWHASSPLLLPG